MYLTEVKPLGYFRYKRGKEGWPSDIAYQISSLKQAYNFRKQLTLKTCDLLRYFSVAMQIKKLI